MVNTMAFQKAQVDLKNRQRLLNSSYGENSPINTNLLPNMPRGSVVIITEEVKDKLGAIQELTQIDGKEYPFILYGKNEGQIIFINRIDAETENLSAVEADHSSLVPALSDFIKKSKKGKGC